MNGCGCSGKKETERDDALAARLYEIHPALQHASTCRQRLNRPPKTTLPPVVGGSVSFSVSLRRELFFFGQFALALGDDFLLQVGGHFLVV